MGINIPSYIINNLRTYGNVAIGNKTFPSRASEEEILDALKQENLTCEFVHTEQDIYNDRVVRRRRKQIARIIRVIRK